MYDRELFEKVINHCGISDSDPVTEQGLEAIILPVNS